MRVRAIETPDGAVKEGGQEARRRETAGIVLKRADQDFRDWKEHEQRGNRQDQAQRRRGEGIPAADASRRQAVTQQHQAGEHGQEGAIAHARLTRAERAEQVGQPFEGPAAVADREPLEAEPDEPREPDRDQPDATARRIGWRPQGKQSHQEG